MIVTLVDLCFSGLKYIYYLIKYTILSFYESLLYPKLYIHNKHLTIDTIDGKLKIPSVKLKSLSWDVYLIKCDKDSKHIKGVYEESPVLYSEDDKLYKYNGRLVIFHPCKDDSHYLIIKDALSEKHYITSCTGFIDYSTIFNEAREQLE